MRLSGLMLSHFARRCQARRALKEGGAAWIRLPEAAALWESRTPAALPPADAESATLAATRLAGRKPDGLWRYATAADVTAFYAARWDEADGRKMFRPLSWSPREGWRFGAWPAPRPLYNLPVLFRRPTAAVVVCEGEKAADAATTIFPDRVATTSSNGAGAAFNSEWTPLAGRAVLLWPDLDGAGAGYARNVATRLTSLGCAVSIIDAWALAAIDPGGGRREPRRKWDAADAAAEWRDLDALAEVAAKLAKPFVPRRPTEFGSGVGAARVGFARAPGARS
jgi:hypothetical protein